MIVDDEPLAHEIIIDYLTDIPSIEVVHQCYSAIEAMQYLTHHPVDILFLDINMPKLSGIEMLRVINNKPQTIITSAYRQYALEGFELSVCDYLLKPIRSERFYQAVNKALSMLGQNNQASAVNLNEDKSLFLKVDKSHVLVKVVDILYCEAYGNYVKVWTTSTMHLTPSSFTRIEQQLLELTPSFTRIHKSFLVNIEAIKERHRTCLTLENGTTLPIGRVYKNNLTSLLP